jgi:hypothetical protein
MAEKRILRTSGPEWTGQREGEELPRKYRDIGWREWLKEDFARYWFVTAVLAVDVLFGLEAMTSVAGAGWFGFIVFLAIVMPCEAIIYLILWGKNGILMSKG